jgi:hypothetical protein
VFINNAEYFCSRCGVHYKLSKAFLNNYFQRYESPLASKILIDKSEDTYTINIPNGSEKHNAFAILFSGMFVLFGSFVIFFTKAAFIFASLLLIIGFLHLFVFFFTYYGSVFITLNEKDVIMKRTFFKISHTKKKNFIKLKSVFEFKISDSIDGIKLDFGNSFN